MYKFIEWQNEKPQRRYVTIEANPQTQPYAIWVYDSVLRVGQFVTRVEEINLEKELERKEREEYERLRKRFED